MRRDIREGVKKHMIDGIKPNYTALAEQYGCDYRTVKAAYEEALQGNKPKTRRTYPSKLDSFKQIIDTWVLRTFFTTFAVFCTSDCE